MQIAGQVHISASPTNGASVLDDATPHIRVREWCHDCHGREDGWSTLVYMPGACSVRPRNDDSYPVVTQYTTHLDEKNVIKAEGGYRTAHGHVIKNIEIQNTERKCERISGLAAWFSTHGTHVSRDQLTGGATENDRPDAPTGT